MSSPVRGSAPPYVTPTAPPWSVLALLPRPFWPWLKNYKGYSNSQIPLAASGVSNVNIQIDTDAWFVMLACTAIVTDTNNTSMVAFRPITTQIYDTSAGMNLFAQPVMFDEIFGDAMQPGLMAFPYIWKPGGTIQTTFTNLDTVNARNVRFTYHGFKANPQLEEDDYPV